MSAKLAETLWNAGEKARPVSADQAAQLRERSVFGKLGIPYLVNRMTVEGGREVV